MVSILIPNEEVSKVNIHILIARSFLIPSIGPESCGILAPPNVTITSCVPRYCLRIPARLSRFLMAKMKHL